MDNSLYAQALQKALTEIRNLSPEINYSFLLSKEGMMIAADDKTDGAVAEKVVQSFQGVMEKSTIIGGLDSYLIEAENGRVCFSQTGDLYLAMMTTKNADIATLQSTPRLIIPAILKLFESVVPSPTAEPYEPNRINPVENNPVKPVDRGPNKPVDTRPVKPESRPNRIAGIGPIQLAVEAFSGSAFMASFSGDTVQVDRELLDEWSRLLEGRLVGQVQIEFQKGKTAVYKVRAINDSAERNGIIRIPSKICRSLGLAGGQAVNVKPVTSSTATQSLSFHLKTS